MIIAVLNILTPACLTNRALRLLSIGYLLVLLAACATAPSQEPAEETAEKEPQQLAWPAPPSEPVIKYVKEIRSDKAFKEAKGSSWKDTLLGEEDDSSNTLRSPFAVAVDKNGRLLVADTFLRGVAVFDFEKQEYMFVGGSGPGMLAKAFGVDSDLFGRIYAADGEAKKLVVFDENGKFLTTMGSEEEFGRPIGVAVDSDRELIYVSDTLKHHIVVFDFTGNHVKTLGIRGDNPLEFNFPQHMAIDDTGRLYVTDSMNFRIQVIEPDHETVTVIGQVGSGPGSFARPKGVAVDADNNIYVVDSAFGNVQMFDQDGNLLMWFGGFGTGPGELQLPSGIAISQDGIIYVADQVNRRIQVFQYLGAPKILEETETENDP